MFVIDKHMSVYIQVEVAFIDNQCPQRLANIFCFACICQTAYTLLLQSIEQHTKYSITLLPMITRLGKFVS